MTGIVIVTSITGAVTIGSLIGLGIMWMVKSLG